MRIQRRVLVLASSLLTRCGSYPLQVYDQTGNSRKERLRGAATASRVLGSGWLQLPAVAWMQTAGSGLRHNLASMQPAQPRESAFGGTVSPGASSCRRMRICSAQLLQCALCSPEPDLSNLGTHASCCKGAAVGKHKLFPAFMSSHHP